MKQPDSNRRAALRRAAKTLFKLLIVLAFFALFFWGLPALNTFITQNPQPAVGSLF